MSGKVTRLVKLREAAGLSEDVSKVEDAILVELFRLCSQMLREASNELQRRRGEEKARARQLREERRAEMAAEAEQRRIERAEADAAEDAAAAERKAKREEEELRQRAVTLRAAGLIPYRVR